MTTFNTKLTDTHTLVATDTLPEAISTGVTVEITTSVGSGEFKVTGLGQGGRQAYFKGQGAAFSKLVEGASKANPIDATIEVN
jgi:hypothetical protein